MAFNLQLLHLSNLKLKGQKVFKKIIQLMFVAVFTVSPMLTIAAENAVLEVKNTPLMREKSVFKESSVIQVSKVEQEVARTVGFKAVDKSEAPTPVNGWFLLLALLGFVILSNRMKI